MEKYPEILKVLKELKENGVTICLATSKPYEFALRILEHFDLKQLDQKIIFLKINKVIYWRIICAVNRK